MVFSEMACLSRIYMVINKKQENIKDFGVLFTFSLDRYNQII